MEDDDEFGDLYTDVIQSFNSSQPSSSAAPPPPLHHPIDPNLNTSPLEDTILTPDPPPQSNPSSQTLAPAPARVSELRDVKLDVADSYLNEKDVNFDIEEDADAGIPGLDAAIPGLAPATNTTANLESKNGGGGDDWDDSEDDLKIVLNEDNPMGMEKGGIGEDDDDDGLVIVTESEHNHGGEQPEWGEEGQQGAGDGERKEMGEAGRGSMMMVPMIGYSNHGYYPFHSQFKYVRPGAVPMPGPAGPGGVPGQVRPPVNMGPTPGRGRGDWRPTGFKSGTPLQKNFHSGFGTPGWGNNMGGRGSGGGLEFTLPSHKTIFEVDIDGFEEKPWKYPGADTSDYFNFGLTDGSWRDYCKQLEQLRLESTMQSKIRVYESGRTEQDYDPDLPPELAAATGMHDFPTENTNPVKSEDGKVDFARGSARMRPPIPTGRAIQVESGYGERLPSCENRPQRMRDPDSVIEIVLQDSSHDDSSANGMPDGTENDSSNEGGSAIDEGDIPPDNKAYFDSFRYEHNNKKSDSIGRKRPLNGSVSEDDEGLPFRPEGSVQLAGSREPTPSSAGGSFGENRGTQRRPRERSPQSTRDNKFSDNQKERSAESMDGRRSPLISSPASHGVADESNAKRRSGDQDEPSPGDENPGREKEKMPLNVNDGIPNHQRTSSRVEQSTDEEFDDGEDSKAARSSDNSKARSGSSRDYQKWRDGVEEEVIQGRSSQSGGMKSHFDQNDQGFQRKGRDVRHEPNRGQMLVKGREGSYPYRDYDPSSVHHLQSKTDALHRRKEREILDVAWQRRDDDPNSRRIRTEEPRKREHGDEMGSRQRSKIRESERSGKDEYMQSRKQLDNGSYRAFYDKDVVSRPREREDSLKVRYDHVDDYHGKRRKDEEYMRRDQIDKEELLQGHRDTTSRRKRERDEVLDQRKRDDQQRVQDNPEDHHSVRHKDESWLQRERGDRQREREERHRPKQSHEEILPKREREDGRILVRGGRVPEDKAWVGHSRGKDENRGSDKEHQNKETVRHGEQSKRRDRVEEESSHRRGREEAHARGNQMNVDQRRSGKERSSTRNERADSQKVHDRTHKDNSRRNKETDVADISTSTTSKRHQDDLNGHSKEMGIKGTGELGVGHSSKRHKENASSDDEHHDTKKGRSKFERWTSQKERDFSISNKSSSTSKFKELDRGSSDGSKLADDSSKPVEAVDNQHPLPEENAGDQDLKDGDTKPSDTDTGLEGRHLDTVEKLKKRSERFKRPLPTEKEPSTTKKIETEVLTSPTSDPPAVVEAEIKPERPARKRRWISS